MNLKRFTLWLVMLSFGLSLAVFDAAAAKRRRRRRQASSARGYLSISSMAQGAVVYLDGKQLGVIPLKKTRLKVGSYRLKVHKLGHLEYSNTIRIRKNKTTTLTIDLLPVASIVDAQSNVKGARLFVNGVEKGVLPKKIELKAGTYMIEVRAKGYLPFKKKMQIVELGQEYPVVASLAADKLAGLPGKGKDVPALDLEPLPDLPLEPPAPAKTDKGKGDVPALDLEPLPDLPLEPPPPAKAKDDVDPLALEPLPDLPLEPPPPSKTTTKTETPSTKTLTAVPVKPGVQGNAFTPPNQHGGVTKVAPGPKNKLYKQWWFWTAAGAVVAATVTGIAVGVAKSQDSGPDQRIYTATDGKEHPVDMSWPLRVLRY